MKPSSLKSYILITILCLFSCLNAQEAGVYYSKQTGQSLYGLVDKEGKKITDPIYAEIFRFLKSDYFQFTSTDGSFGILNSEGKELFVNLYADCEFELIERDLGYCKKVTNGKETLHFLDFKTNKEIFKTENEYEIEISHRGNFIYFITFDDNTFILNRKGEKLPIVFENMKVFRGGILSYMIIEDGKEIPVESDLVIKDKGFNAFEDKQGNLFIEIEKLNGKNEYFNQKGKKISAKKYNQKRNERYKVIRGAFTFKRDKSKKSFNKQYSDELFSNYLNAEIIDVLYNSNSITKENAQGEFIGIIAKENDNFLLFNEEGELQLKDSFDHLAYEDDEFSGNYLKVFGYSNNQSAQKENDLQNNIQLVYQIYDLESKEFLGSVIKTNGLFGFRDAKDQLLVPMEYDDVNFHNIHKDYDEFKCLIVSKEDKYFLYDLNKNSFVFSTSFDRISVNSDKFIELEKNEIFGYYNPYKGGIFFPMD